MKIGIDARMYGPKQGGLGRYIEQLILHLEQLESDNEFVIFLRHENWEEYQPVNQRFKKVLADVPWYGWQEQLKLPGLIKKEKIDLMHFPHWNVPLFYNNPFVVTIHDLLLLHYPTREASTLGIFGYWFKNLAYKFVLRHAASKSKHIIAVSEFTKQDIHKTLGVPLEKISVTYQAPFVKSKTNQNRDLPATSYPDFAMAQNRGSAIPANRNRDQLQPHKYILYVGVAYPHKNLAGLLKAWKIFTEKYGNDYQLVLAGKTNYFYTRLKSSIFNLQSSNVVFTDFIPDSELPALYEHALLYIMPSLYEGFALPSLEAMTYGIPVASSNATCLPEILGSAALYFDPKDYSAMAETIHAGITNQPLRQTLVQESRRLLQRYDWNELAKKTYAIYQKVV